MLMALLRDFVSRNTPESCPKHPNCRLQLVGLLLLCPRGCLIVEHPFETGVWITVKERKKILERAAKKRKKASTHAG